MRSFANLSRSAGPTPRSVSIESVGACLAHLPAGSTMMASISTGAPRGNSATPTAARAGYGVAEVLAP